MKTKKKVGEGNQITSLFRRYHNILVTVSKPTSKGIISYNCYLNLHSCLKRKEKKKNPWRRLFSTRKSTFNMCKIVFMSSTMKRNSMSMKLSGLKFIVLNSEGRCWNYIFVMMTKKTLHSRVPKENQVEKRKGNAYSFGRCLKVSISTMLPILCGQSMNTWSYYR